MNSYPGDYVIYNDSVSVNREVTIHSGNYPGHTLGCLLPGKSWGGNATWGNNWGSHSAVKRNGIRAFVNKVGYRNIKFNIFDVFR